MYPERHVLRFGTYMALTAAVRSRRGWPLAAAGVFGVAYARRPLRRVWRRRAAAGERVAGVAVVPALMAFVDAAKMWGYLRGLATRLRPPR